MDVKSTSDTKNTEEKVGSSVILYENLLDQDYRDGTPMKWIGSDEVRIELVTSTVKQAQAAAQAFANQFKLAGLEGDISVSNTSSKDHRNFPEGCSAVVIKSVKIKPPVKPEPLLALVGVTLWIEPNKIEKVEEKDRWELIEGGGKEGAEAMQRADKIRFFLLCGESERGNHSNGTRPEGCAEIAQTSAKFYSSACKPGHLPVPLDTSLATHNMILSLKALPCFAISKISGNSSRRYQLTQQKFLECTVARSVGVSYKYREPFQQRKLFFRNSSNRITAQS
eukprot:734311-Amorphochlora_amoeboformis.AAC.1